MIITRFAFTTDGRDRGHHYSFTVSDRSFDVWIRPVPDPDPGVHGEQYEVAMAIGPANSFHRLLGQLLEEA
jgi:hypothetical protein